jgi:glycosyltransferase involved in cell wall biosynthesis
MNILDQITVLILSYNEEANISRTLDVLSGFQEIVVVDSGSTDDTMHIAGRYHNVRCVTRPFDSHAAQWNFGLASCGIKRSWVLALDADYVLTPGLIEEICRLEPSEATGGYQIGFRYCIQGQALSATLYPAHIALYRRENAHYVQEGHTQRVVVRGGIEILHESIDHDDRKPLSRWLNSQQKYAGLEAGHLLSKRRADLRLVDRIRLKGWLAPILVFLHTLFLKRCVFDGRPGWIYVLQRTLAETMIALEITDRKMRSKGLESNSEGVTQRIR